MANSMFVPDGAEFMPTPLTAGPWDPTVLHGGPVGALFAELLEALGGPDFDPVRLTVDLLRPVPLRSLSFDGRIVRQGRRLQLLAGELRASATLVARCSLLRLSPRPVEIGPTGDGGGPPVDDPEVFHPTGPLGREGPIAFVGGAIEVRSATSETFLGAGAAWFRLGCDVLPDRPPSPLALSAAVGDMGNALSAPSAAWPPPVSYVNADMALHLSRMPEGGWLRAEAASTWSETGIGLVRSELADRSGPVGVAHQSLALDIGLATAGTRPVLA